MSRKRIFTTATATAVLVLSGVLCLWINRHPDSISREDSRRIVEKAMTHLEANRTDSAMACYSAVVALDSDNDSDMQRLQASSFNNMGYIMFYSEHDPINAYSFFLNALSIAEKTGYTELIPYIHLNIANVKAGRDNPKAIEMYRQSFSGAVSNGNITLANIAYRNPCSCNPFLHPYLHTARQNQASHRVALQSASERPRQWLSSTA